MVALMMAVFFFSLLGIPLTAGFMGKVFLFWGPLGLVPHPGVEAATDSYMLNVGLAVIGMLNAAIGGWYYLRVVAAIYLREPAEPRPPVRSWPALSAIVVCAAVTVLFGVWTAPLLNVVQKTDRLVEQPTPAAV